MPKGQHFNKINSRIDISHGDSLTKDTKGLRPLPKPPAVLKKNGAKIWRTDGVRLREIGILQDTDIEMFTRYCAIFDEIESLNKDIDKAKDAGLYPSITTEGRYGTQIKVSPLFTMKIQLEKHLVNFAIHFGLTSMARARIGLTISQTQGELDKYDFYFE